METLTKWFFNALILLGVFILLGFTLIGALDVAAKFFIR